ncbi:hypothetical protein SKAU_G00268400 [Synaphobranchus kaupii]|uniref:Uncharacterized protein n=1 Tax=Synaphobranchus kaupii TaxID=118154 RepID=A0A9Q1F033_SYNKA|nr:hypothetical protein SKAU_G00268400 [Synaphobranchus kaupii]
MPEQMISSLASPRTPRCVISFVSFGIVLPWCLISEERCGALLDVMDTQVHLAWMENLAPLGLREIR